MEDAYNTYEVKRATADIRDLKENIRDIKIKDNRQDDRLNGIEKKQAVMEEKLDSIIKNTAQTNRMIQQAIYGALATGIIGGAITILWSSVGGGG